MFYLNDVIKHTFLTPFYCKFQGSPYLCNVFFIVLDLRLTKVGLSGALFYVYTFRLSTSFLFFCSFLLIPAIFLWNVRTSLCIFAIFVRQLIKYRRI